MTFKPSSNVCNDFFFRKMPDNFATYEA